MVQTWASNSRLCRANCVTALRGGQDISRDRDYSVKIISIIDLNRWWFFLEAKYTGISPETVGQIPSSNVFVRYLVSAALLRYEYANCLL